MKDYVKEYRGHKVPEGATHWMGSAFAKWMDDYKICTIGCHQGATWKAQSYGMPRTAIELPEAPQEWMPDVGEYCRVESGEGGDWNDGIYVGIDSHGSHVFDVEEKFLWRINSISDFVRPLKTQQEKDREAFINTAIRSIDTTKFSIGQMDIVSKVINQLAVADFSAPKADEK